MRKTIMALFILALIVATHPATTAQSSAWNYELADSSRKQRAMQGPCGGGIVDHLAISKPAPVTRPKTKAARVAGRVFVQVQIDEEGKVVWARVCSGPTSLRRTSLDAAYKARFAATLLAGKPVKVTGVLTYNFTRR